VINNLSHFIIDQGNSVTKIAFFQNDFLIKKASFEDAEISGLRTFLEIYPTGDIFFSTVRATASEIEVHLPSSHRLIYLDRTHQMPFLMDYSTPDTIGLDRLANAAGAIERFGARDILIIDCGTCITSTFLKNGVLKGGAISPGIRIRFAALHQFTGGLPLLDFDHALPKMIGDSSSGSIRSGVIWGIIHEIRGTIDHYCSENDKLNVIITGGDGGFLGSYLKSPIFADENLTLRGLHQIYLFNYCEKII
jgi:type III pantothenate kinase